MAQTAGTIRIPVQVFDHAAVGASFNFSDGIFNADESEDSPEAALLNSLPKTSDLRDNAALVLPTSGTETDAAEDGPHNDEAHRRLMASPAVQQRFAAVAQAFSVLSNADVSTQRSPLHVSTVATQQCAKLDKAEIELRTIIAETRAEVCNGDSGETDVSAAATAPQGGGGSADTAESKEEQRRREERERRRRTRCLVCT